MRDAPPSGEMRGCPGAVGSFRLVVLAFLWLDENLPARGSFCLGPVRPHGLVLYAGLSTQIDLSVLAELHLRLGRLQERL